MCGIIAYLGEDTAADVLIEGLKALEYRGYDSAGLTTIDEDHFVTRKQTGHVQQLANSLGKNMPRGTVGLGHTRWATHGAVTIENTHPHISMDGKFALVHNGVIENFAIIKTFLQKEGYSFYSETDTEVLTNLIAHHYERLSKTIEEDSTRFHKAIIKALTQVEGTYGIVVLCKDCPEEMIGVRKSSPLILGVNDTEHLLVSDAAALMGKTNKVVYLNDGDCVHVKNKSFKISTLTQESVPVVFETLDWKPEQAELGNASSYMEKEIFEQPTALQNAMRGRFSEDGSTAHFGGLNLSPQELRQIDRILLCACGTAWHSCLIAEYLIERYSRIPVEVEYASEFRYKNAPLDKHTLIFVISQSGETLDTLAALREAKRKGYRTLAITNVVGSTIARESDGGIYQHAGPEIGVASTKAFTSQLLIAGLIALHLGRLRDMSYEEGVSLVNAFKEVPKQVEAILAKADSIKKIAQKYAHFNDFLFLGRQLMFPIALEGALKLKEISYIHAEGYPAAELKHGPIALISPECPSLFLAPQGYIFNKTLSNIQEVKARGGPLIAVTSEGSDFPENLVDDIIYIPSSHGATQPILATIPMQLLSYYIAQERNCNVDRPRNLAKAVTVE